MSDVATIAIALLAAWYTYLQWRTAEYSRRTELSKLYLENYRLFEKSIYPVHIGAQQLKQEDLINTSILLHEAKLFLEKDLIKDLEEYSKLYGELYALQVGKDPNNAFKISDLFNSLINSNVKEKYRNYMYVPFSVSPWPNWIISIVKPFKR